MTRGRFITFEGIEGSGKSTQAARLASGLREADVAVRTTREPGGSPCGERIRAVLLDPALHGLAAETEMLLFAAARAQHVRETIRPALTAGDWVISDRFLHSSLAYQGVGRGLGRDVVRAANAPALDGLLPDLVVLIDVPAEIGVARARGRARLDRIEAESLEFHGRVREAFLEEARLDPSRFLVLDGTGDVGVLEEVVAQAIRDRWPR